MLHRFRTSSRLAILLVLALVAGPAASALCPGDMHEAATPMDHGDMAAMNHEAPPCHEEAPTPEPQDADCLSPCCTVAPEAPAPAPPAPPTVTVALLPPVVGNVEEPDATPEADRLGTVADPPAPPLRVHLLLGRFLT